MKSANHKMPRVCNSFRLCLSKSRIRMSSSCCPPNRSRTRRVASSNYLGRYSLFWAICWMKSCPYSFSLIGFPSKCVFTIRSAIMSINVKSWQAKSYRSLVNSNTCWMQKGSKCQRTHEMNIKLSWKMIGMIFWVSVHKETPVWSSKRTS